ncbi:hypothetical protein HY405_00625, partial [Candidatus Microgenomates bacterium]|nr:hypothetical protein [Candidatus Microgenomates bacterium]
MIFMRQLPVAFLSLLSIFFFISPVFSQDAILTFKRAYEDYVFSYTLYRSAETDYQFARGQYLTFKTLDSRRNAQEATAKLLTLRDEVVKTYLTAVRTKLRETKGVIDDSTYYGLIDPEVVWFIAHKGTISTSNSLDELVSKSDEARDRHGMAEVAIYQTLSGITIGNLNSLRQELILITQSTKNKIESIKQTSDPNERLSDRKIQTIERWMGDVETRLARSREKEFQGQAVMAERLHPDYTADNFGNYIGGVQPYFEESLQNLREASSFLKE